MDKSLGTILKEIRANKGITQQELADQLFVTRQTISRWENDNCIPNLVTLNKISDYYDIPLKLLLTPDDTYYNLKKDKNNTLFYKLSFFILTLTLILLIPISITKKNIAISNDDINSIFFDEEQQQLVFDIHIKRFEYINMVDVVYPINNNEEELFFSIEKKYSLKNILKKDNHLVILNLNNKMNTDNDIHAFNKKGNQSLLIQTK